MSLMKTELGKIYCSYDDNIQDFKKVRVIDIQTENDKTIYTLKYLDNDYNFTEDKLELTPEQYKEFQLNWILLKSDGIVSISNVISVENSVRQIKDVVLLFFPNDPELKFPDLNKPYVVARQGILNIFDDTELSVGASVSLTSMPTGYTLSDFMENSGVISSKLCHIYKIDTNINISTILNNDETNNILIDLYEHQCQYLRNTDPEFDDENKPDCLSGYNNTLLGFIKNSGFLKDVDMTIGIMPIDFELEEEKPIEEENRIFLSVLYGGIKIEKAVPLKFEYDIDLSRIKMKYLMVRDKQEKPWIIPYTSSPDEVDGAALAQLNEERLEAIHKRLQDCINVYMNSIPKSN